MVVLIVILLVIIIFIMAPDLVIQTVIGLFTLVVSIAALIFFASLISLASS